MQRREVIALLGGAAAYPITAQAQQPEGMRRIAVLGALATADPEVGARVAAFQQALAALGWTQDRNLRIDYRWAEGNAGRVREYAAELVALAPDVILAVGSPVVGPLLQATRTVPVVFLNVVDPVGSGYAASLARPGGNATGFSQFEYRISGKWMELLAELTPSLSQVAVIRDIRTAPGIGQFAVIQAMAPPGIELLPVNTASAAEIENAITALGRSQNGGGVIVTAGGTAIHRDLIISLVARHRLPTVFPFRYYVTSGGLISYGPNSIDPIRRAAGYVDRILKGEKPADMPVLTPTRYELVVNLKTAKALGLTIPPSLLARADEVIE